MGEITSYRLIDFLPFSFDVYARLFARLNQELWPAHILVGLAVVALVILFVRRRGAIAAILLGGLWLLSGWAFFLERYADLVWAAPYVGWAFIAQAGMLGGAGLAGWFERPDGLDRWSWSGAAIAGWALFAHPLLAPLSGRGWASAEFVGLAPDPTALFTLGLLLVFGRRRWPLIPIPLVWCILSGLTAVAMDYPAGLATPVSAVAALLVTIASAWLGGRER